MSSDDNTRYFDTEDPNDKDVYDAGDPDNDLSDPSQDDPSQDGSYDHKQEGATEVIDTKSLTHLLNDDKQRSSSSPSDSSATANEPDNMATRVLPTIDLQEVPEGSNSQKPPKSQKSGKDSRSRSIVASVIGISGEILLTAAVFLGFYILWQLWWTGVVASHDQQAQVNQVQWVQPKEVNGSYKIAKPQDGPPPVVAAPDKIGALIGQVYIPRFGATWHHNLVQGASLKELDRFGLCHYVGTQMPGAVGNFAVAGHRSGYGQPLGNINEMQKGDKIIVRTENYWYVYEDTSYEIVLPSQISVIAPVPNHPGETPTERLITLTTCTPRYVNATHRWIVYGKFLYWAKVSDGIPEALATPSKNGKILFTQATPSWTTKIPPLSTILLWLIIAYVIFFISSAVAWRWPGLKKNGTSSKKSGSRKRKDNSARVSSMYGFLYRIQPGIAVVRWIELILLICIFIVCSFQWIYPAMASNIPYLRVTSSYVGVNGV